MEPLSVIAVTPPWPSMTSRRGREERREWSWIWSRLSSPSCPRGHRLPTRSRSEPQVTDLEVLAVTTSSLMATSDQHKGGRASHRGRRLPSLLVARFGD
ncbi:hypothetical protein E2562_021893 [Oryza meyeriana var. granulata]|uniref:Uncharacterized protein n=1 Tax=Oryza meyeriana var. granulata TaxID=110450 RepID=A0A6G1C831_9ORYZ|nr:hypothetical protein E2562_021893 [Oryza meyeriana var. granulata]